MRILVLEFRKGFEKCLHRHRSFRIGGDHRADDGDDVVAIDADVE